MCVWVSYEKPFWWGNRIQVSVLSTLFRIFFFFHFPFLRIIVMFFFVLVDSQKLSQHHSRTHSRSSSEGQRLKMDPGDSDIVLKTDSVRTDSPDNDSAFSDTVSMLSSESSASSGGSGTKPQTLQLGQNVQVSNS